MARGLNKVEIIGHCGRDPEMRYTPNGKAVSSVSVAVSRTYTTSDGNSVDETEWFNVEAWGRTAEVLNQYAKKGDRIYVEGRQKTDQWEKDGEKHYRVKLVAENIILLGSRNGGGASEPEPAEEQSIEFN